MKELRMGMPISQEVYQKIKYDILENNLKPGEKLIEENIATELNVSRTPVREALKQLDQDGLVTYFPRRGSVVSDISLEDAKELYEVREVLEGLAIKHICMNINRKDLKKLGDIVSNMEKAMAKDDYEYMTELHKVWSETTFMLIQSDLLKSYLTSIMDNLGRLRKISLYNPVHSYDAFKETRDIYNAIAENQPGECEILARLHVRNARKRFEGNIGHIE